MPFGASSEMKKTITPVANAIQAGTMETVRHARSEAFSSSSKKILNKGKRKEPMISCVTPAPCQARGRKQISKLTSRRGICSWYHSTYSLTKLPQPPTTELTVVQYKTIDKWLHPSWYSDRSRLTGICGANHFLFFSATRKAMDGMSK